MTKEPKMPVLENVLYRDFTSSRTEDYVKRYNDTVFAILNTLGMFDKEHIMRYLRARSADVIYHDACTERPFVVQNLTQKAKSGQSDAWAFIRRYGCISALPDNTDFEFTALPFAEYANEKILSYISLNDNRLVIDYAQIKKDSQMMPTAAQEQLYQMAVQICNIMNKTKLPSQCTLINRVNGIYEPNIYAIMAIEKWERRKV